MTLYDAANKRWFVLSDEEAERFQALLNREPVEKPRLSALLNETPIWDANLS